MVRPAADRRSDERTRPSGSRRVTTAAAPRARRVRDEQVLDRRRERPHLDCNHDETPDSAAPTKCAHRDRGRGAARPAYEEPDQAAEAGRVAIIHHTDLDRVSAEALVETGVSAVVNAVPSVSGRYPNLGPGILMDAGIPLIDDVGEQVFTTVHEGDRLVVDGGRLVDRTARCWPRARSTPPRSSTSSWLRPGGPVRPDRGVRRQHHDLSPGGEGAAARGRRGARGAHPDRGPARADRGPRLRLPQ